MRDTFHYISTRILAGILVLLPITVAVILVSKVLSTLGGVSETLAAAVPGEKIGLLPVATFFGVLLLLLLLFLLGVLLAPRRRATESSWLERTFLDKVPGYALIKSTVHGAVGMQGEDGPRAGILRRSAHVEEFVLILDELGDGRSVIFIPSAPSATSGGIIVVRSDLVEPIDADITSTLRVIREWGRGAAKVLPPART